MRHKFISAVLSSVAIRPKIIFFPNIFFIFFMVLKTIFNKASFGKLLSKATSMNDT